MSGRGGILALAAGGACIALSPVCVRLAETSPGASAFWRVFLATPLLWMAMRWFERGERAQDKQATPATPTDWRPLLLAGFCFAGDLAVWHAALMYTSVANATIEANFAPLFVAIFAWLFYRVRPSGRFVVALAITLAGAILLVGPNLGEGGNRLYGDLLGVVTAMFYAGYMLALQAASATSSTLRTALASTAVAALLLAPYALLTADRLVPASANGWIALVVLATVAHALGQTLIAYALARVPAALASVFLLVQPILSALYAWVLIGEAMVAAQMAGAAVILVGIYLAKRAA